MVLTQQLVATEAVRSAGCRLFCRSHAHFLRWHRLCAIARQFQWLCGVIAQKCSPCPSRHCCCHHLTRRLPGAVGTLISFDLDLFHSSGVQRACKGRVLLYSRSVFARWLFGACMCVQVSARAFSRSRSLSLCVCCEMIIIYFYCVGFHLRLL